MMLYAKAQPYICQINCVGCKSPLFAVATCRNLIQCMAQSTALLH